MLRPLKQSLMPLAIAAAVAPGGGPSGTAALTSGAGSSLRSDFPGNVGFAFTPGRSLTVSALGRWVIGGNSQTHVIGIWNGSGTLLGSVTVNCSGATAGQYLYGTLGSSISLASGTQYYIGSAETSGGDQWYDAFAVTSTSDLTVNYASYGAGSAGPLGNGVGGAYVYVPLNFLYF